MKNKLDKAIANLESHRWKKLKHSDDKAIMYRVDGKKKDLLKVLFIENDGCFTEYTYAHP